MNISKNKYAGAGNTIKNIIDVEYGHRRSRVEKGAVDKNGDPIPWMTYPAISYIQNLDLSDKEIFEWGSGNSSLFFSKRAKSITSIELKSDWYDYVVSKKLNNMSVVLANNDNYAKIITDTPKKYDLIVVDGEIDRRYQCAEYAVNHLKNNGMIILDNSDWLENTCSYLRSRDFIQVDMAGFGPINSYTWCTSFFLSREFDFSPIGKKQPDYVLGGLRNVRD